MSSGSKPFDRRSVLRMGVQAAALGIAASVPPGLRAAAADPALVCIYLSGGNDSNNMIVPLADYDAYARARGGLAIRSADLLRVRSSGSGAEFGFHPALTDIAGLFNEGVLAVVANTGTAGSVPQGHSDPMMTYLPGGYMLPAWAASWSQAPITGFDGASSGSSPLVLMSRNGGGSTRRRQLLSRTASAAVQWRSDFPASALGRQLQQVAASIASGESLGRQVYMVHAPGFDTHTHEAELQGRLFADLSRSLAAFYRALAQVGAADRVIAFTDTEFNRALVPNALGGTDHGWGGHQLVLGGAALGGQTHGDFPALQPGRPQDATGAGVWIPAISREHYAGKLASWLGLDYAEVSRLLPGIQSSAKAAPDFLA